MCGCIRDEYEGTPLSPCPKRETLPTYRIEIDASEFQPGGTLEDWYASPRNVPPDVTDSDGNQTTHDITVVVGMGDVDMTNDFGFDILSDYEITT